MKFLDIFNEIEKGNYALTDEAVYYSIQNNDEMIPLWGGNKSHTKVDRMVSRSANTKKGQSINVFTGEGIVISLDGSAGSMTYKRSEHFALNHHAGFITVKNNKEDEIDMEYFALFYQNFYRSLAVSDGSKTLSLNQIYTEEFELPSVEFQNRIIKELKEVKDAIEKLNELDGSFKEILDQEISIRYSQYQAYDVPIKEAIDYMSGNSGLTEELIYQSLQNEGEKFKVLSSSTEDRTMMGEIPMCKIGSKPLKVFTNKEGLLVTRNGKAGRTRYLERDNYTMNDHAYILYVRDECSYEIDLRWLALQYKSEFLSYSSNSDNGTWNMTGFFKYTKIDIPKLQDQLKLINIWEKVIYLVDKINDVKTNLDELLNKEISTIL